MKIWTYTTGTEITVDMDDDQIYYSGADIYNVLGMGDCDEEWLDEMTTMCLTPADPAFHLFILKKTAEYRDHVKEIRDTKFNNLQYLQKGSKDQKNSIKIKDRIVQLGYIPKDHMYKLMNYTKIGEFQIKHPDNHKLHSHLLILSHKFNSTKKKRDGKYAEIRRNGRSNMYILKDYHNFGDNIIQEYFYRKPYDSWGCRPDMDIIANLQYELNLQSRK